MAGRRVELIAGERRRGGLWAGALEQREHEHRERDHAERRGRRPGAPLRVADASVTPTIVRGHTNAATIAIAERAANVIRSGARSAQAAGHRAQPAMT